MKIKTFTLLILIIFIFILTYTSSYFLKLESNYPNLVNFLLSSFKHEKKELEYDFISFYFKNFLITTEFKEDYREVNKLQEVVLNTNEPLIYIYSTHSNEEYSYNKNDIYNIVPTVKTASYILEENLHKLGLNSIVEKENTTDIVNKKKLLYKDSYKISRTLLENRKIEYPSLTYFLDIHRDSVKRNITTTKIKDLEYAKIMFVLGLENENYKMNKEVITKINDYLNINYPGISRGIYEKIGSGVNGIYNQDFSSNVMLIEVGGIDNTIDEVSRSIKIIAEAIFHYINL